MCGRQDWTTSTFVVAAQQPARSPRRDSTLLVAWLFSICVDGILVGRDTGRSFGSSIPPPDLPGSRIGEWSPFNVRNFSRSNCSLITLAREHHAAIDRLRQAEAEASASPDAVFNVLPRFQQPTQNLTLRQWPRGDIPATELLPRQRKRTTSRFVSPARGTTDYARTGSDLLLARKLPPGPYLWAGAGAPPALHERGWSSVERSERQGHGESMESAEPSMLLQYIECRAVTVRGPVFAMVFARRADDA